MVYREPQGLERWANTDPSLHITGDSSSSRGAKWVRVWIYCLNMKDREAAETIRLRNTKAALDAVERKSLSASARPTI